MGGGVFSLAVRVREIAEQRPDAIAVSCGERVFTYPELDARSDRLAGLLSALGVAPGDRLAHLDLNAPEACEMLLAAIKVGAVMAPLNHRLTAAELQRALDDMSPAVCVAGPAFADTVGALEGTGHVLTYGTADEDAPWHDHAPGGDHVLRPGDVVVQHSTSGTTGVSKGVMLDAANLQASTAHQAGPWRLHERSRSVIASPTFHIGGLGWILNALAAGGACVMVPQVVPADLLDLLERERITVGLLVPTVLQMLCAIPGAADRDWSHLEAIAYGASPITSSALKRALRTFGCDFYQLYGSTETVGAITQLDPEDHDPDGPREHLLRSAGKAYDWLELEVVDAEGRALAPLKVGEVRVRAPTVMPGYYRRPEETAAVLSPDGWFRTGDGGYLDEEGYLFLTDRIKDMIVSGGENVYPIEVEEVLAKHPAVAEVAVIGVPDERWVETVAAIVVAVPGTALEPDELVAFARSELAGFKLPRVVRVVDELPKTPTGKILKRELREAHVPKSG